MSTVTGSLFRRLLFWAHLCCGVAAGIVILLMSVTGVLLTYEHQMVEGASQRNHVQVPPTSTMLTADALANAAQRHAPPGAQPSLVFDATPAAPVQVTVGRDNTLLLNPYTGEKLDDAATGRRAFFRTIENWHRWMGAAPRSLPASIVDAANLLFLFLIISGIYLWLPDSWRWRTVRGLVLFRTHYINAKVRDFNWHHVCAVWMLIPLLLIALSGVVMSYGWANNLLYAAFGEQAPQRPAGPPPGNGGNEPRGPAANADAAANTTPRASLQQLLESARANAGDWQRITLPTTLRGDRVSIAVELRSNAPRAPRQNIVLSTADGRLLEAPPVATQTPGQRARIWLRFVHTGEQYGVVGQTIAGLASLAACVLVYTGLALAWRRLIRPLFLRSKPA
jgi:uncharacterized iron-regulated membrane protein